jgi:hypothetical protein
LWGGVYNPIIPVCSVIPVTWQDHPFPTPSPAALAKGYISFFEPDVFVEAKEGLAVSIGLPQSKLDFHRSRIVPLDAFFETDNQRGSSVPFGTGIFQVYKDLYEREFKFVRRQEHRVALLEPDAASALFVEALFGGFPSLGPLAPISQAYVDAFDPVKLAATAESWIKVVKEGLRPPLNFTIEGLKRAPDGWSEPTLFVVDPASRLDLIDLWNIRQFHPQILGISLPWFQDAKDFLAEFLRANYRPLPRNQHGVMIRPTIQFGRSVSKELAEAAAQQAGLVGMSDAQWLFKLWYDRVWEPERDDFVHRPKRAGISAAGADLELAVSKDGPDLTCRFTSLSPDFADTYDDAAARWVNVLKFSGQYDGNDNLALTLPTSFGDDEGSRLRLGEPTIFSREGFVLPQQHKQQREYLCLMTGKDAVIDWLGRQGVRAEPSEPGRVADQVLASLQGFWGSHLIADADTLRLLDEMSKSVRKHTDGKIEEFPDRSIEVKRWEALVHRRSQQGLPRVDLDDFIKANIFRLGLALECPNCRKENWFSIEALQKHLTCERCLQIFDFPQGSLRFSKTPWHYRVVGPYSVPDYAAGAYATVLALRAFARGFGAHDTNLTYATGLHFTVDDQKPFEVDFTFWYQRRRILDLEEDPVLAFGEAKSFAAESFKEGDLARMRKLAEKFTGAFLVFATLKEELSETEKAMIGELATWGRERLPDRRPRAPVIVLTGIELFSSRHIEHSWKERGGRHAKFVEPPSVRLDNLWNLAEFTQQLYLGLPNPYAQLLASAPPS